MSGSDGGGFGAPPAATCETLVIDTILVGPKPDVIEHIELGDVLMVDTDESDGQRTVVVKHRGEIAGGLVAPLLQKLRECIEGGTEYRAKVTRKNGALIRVRVSAVTL